MELAALPSGRSCLVSVPEILSEPGRRVGPMIAKLRRNPPQPSSLFHHERTRRFEMFKGGLLWLIGIPLPIILILFFLGYLS
jgi:hypothetical protein